LGSEKGPPGTATVADITVRMVAHGRYCQAAPRYESSILRRRVARNQSRSGAKVLQLNQLNRRLRRAV
jgi:hypothetical protein